MLYKLVIRLQGIITHLALKPIWSAGSIKRLEWGLLIIELPLCFYLIAMTHSNVIERDIVALALAYTIVHDVLDVEKGLDAKGYLDRDDFICEH